MGFVAQPDLRAHVPKPQTELCHDHRHGRSQFCESIEDGSTHIQLNHLSFKRTGHHFFTQTLEAIHLRFHQRPAVVAAPVFPDFSTKSPARFDRFIADRKRSAFSQLRAFAWWNDRNGIATSAGLVHILGVVRAIARDAGNGFIFWNLIEQFSSHRRITDLVGGHHDGADLQGVGIDAQMHFAPLATSFSSMLLGLPFAFTQEFDARGIHEHVKTPAAFACAVRHLDIQRFLPAAHRAVVGGCPG